MTVFSRLIYTFNDDMTIYAEPGDYEKISEALEHLTKALKADGVQYKRIYIKLDNQLWRPHKGWGPKGARRMCLCRKGRHIR